MTRLSFVALACMCVVVSVQAQVSVPIENIEVSSSYSSGGHCDKWNLTNDNLGGGGSTANGVVWDTWGVIRDDNGVVHPNSDKAPWIAFYFGGEYILDEMMIWNYLRGWESGRGVRDTIVLVSTDTGEDWLNYTFTPLLGQDPDNAPGVYRFDSSSELSPEVVQTIGLGGVPATAVKFQILSNWSGTVFGPDMPSELYWSSNTIAGLRKVVFNGTPVPEPTTMTLLAMGGLALLRRRR